VGRVEGAPEETDAACHVARLPPALSAPAAPADARPEAS
jgi:hypothetical protein